MAIYKKTTVKRNDNVKQMVFELKINNPPQPLVLLINPSSLETRYVPKVSEQRVRWVGSNIPYIFHAQHDELDVLSATGKSAMFISDEKGLTRIERRKTTGYENIARLLAMYRNNGTNRNTKPDGKVNPCTIESVGRVVLSYNGFIYRGHFMNFSISENDSMQFNMDFSFEFKVTNTFNLDQVSGNSVLQRTAGQ